LGKKPIAESICHGGATVNLNALYAVAVRTYNDVSPSIYSLESEFTMHGLRIQF
jgi:hypothetical protein